MPFAVISNCRDKGTLIEHVRLVHFIFAYKTTRPGTVINRRRVVSTTGKSVLTDISKYGISRLVKKSAFLLFTCSFDSVHQIHRESSAADWVSQAET